MGRTSVMIGDSFGEDFTCAVVRTKAGFLEMPGLTLTAAQATRLFALEPALCELVLKQLVESRFLVRTRNATFVRSE